MAWQGVATLLPSKVTVTVSFSLKPLPTTVAVLPTEPPSVIISTDGVTLKCVASENPLSSITVSLWLPALASGTSNSQSKLPLAPEVQALPLSSVRATVVSPKAKVMGRNDEKPVPLTETLLSTAPSVKLSATSGVTV